jgi:DNA-binding winged helix-turn-helix (wHTH) protein/Tol biopolymer transport system component
MEVPVNHSRKVRFGVFEVDLAAQKLCKRGSPVRLQEKPFRLLCLLLEHPGKVVTREELRRRLWSSDTFVEFDEGVNAAVGKVRYALRDSPEKPVFFETVRGQGYRWIAPIESIENVDGAARSLRPADGASPAATGESARERGFGVDAITSHTRTFVVIGLVISVIVSTIGVIVYLARPRRVVVQHTEVKQRQLTTNSQDNPVSANAISPDGKYLAYADLKGLHVKSTTTGEVRDIPNPAPYVKSYVEWGIPQNWLPDGTRFLVNTNLPYQPVSTWVVSVLGGPPRKIRDDAGPWSVSPDGKIAYTTQLDRIGYREIWIMDDDGQNPRKLLSGDEDSGFSMLVWSPDGGRIAYIKDHNNSGTDETSIESIDLRNSAPITIVPSTLLRTVSSLPSDLRSLIWLPDGRLIYSAGERDTNGFTCNYWQLQVNSNTGLPITEPEPLTSWAGFCLIDVSATENGKQLVFQKMSGHRRVFVADFDRKAGKITVPKLLTDQEDQEFPTAWTPDSKEVVFASNRNGGWQLLRQKYGVEKADLIASRLTDVADQTPVAPDGSSVLNVATISSGQRGSKQVSRIPLAGGASEPLMTGAVLGVRCSQSLANRCVVAEESPDHEQFVFSKLDPHQGRGSELVRVNREDITANYEWALSPDGTMIAFAKQFDESIRLIPLNGEVRREVHVQGWHRLRNITFAADGKSFFASHPSKSGVVLLLVNENGVAKVLWEVAGQNVYLRAIPSPDGRHLAILASLVDNNVWMMENF